MVPHRPMEEDRNETFVVMFVLLGLSDKKEVQLMLFPIFLVIYLVTLTWNLGLIILIRMDSQLHTPMYFFLSFLSFIDMCYSSSATPRMLSDFLKEEKVISFITCAAQYFFGSWMAHAECCLLATMAYDRFVGIGRPLQYSAIMSLSLCQKMVAWTYGTGFLGSIIQTVSCFHLYYCGPNTIPNFFCDITHIISLSCSNPFISQMILFMESIFVGFSSFLVILLSYAFTAASILKISSITSAKGRSKAFNTCASHLTAVTFFYSSSIFVYLSSSSGGSSSFDRFASVFYTVVIPMLNPLIYSLRNKEIKDALKRLQKNRKYC
uniref:G-protein coupled receptors family 1 profile domain-containing protein n=1 Tax=Equus asinus asinus TaxID=83772 RepID=A0A8C4KVS9_EQUAS